MWSPSSFVCFILYLQMIFKQNFQEKKTNNQTHKTQTQTDKNPTKQNKNYTTSSGSRYNVCQLRSLISECLSRAVQMQPMNMWL